MKTILTSLSEILRVSTVIASLAFASLCHAAPEWLVVTGDGDEGERVSDTKVVNIPAGRSAILVIALASEEYPDWTGPSSEFNDILEWDIELSVGDGVEGSVDVNNRHSEWEDAELEGITLQGFSPVHIERMVGLTAPENSQLTVTLEAAATNTSDDQLPSTVILGVLLIKPLELHPALVDGSEATIPNSQVPRIAPNQTNGMIEQREAHNFRIAYRELKFEVEGADNLLEDKEVTWTLEALYIAPGTATPDFRGDWAHAVVANSQNRFEVSAQYGAYAYALDGQASSTTELDDSSQTAIRVNMPPIGFNLGRVKIEIEDVDGDPMDVLDLEVPAVVVVDPGHGGSDPGAVNGTTEEEDLTLDYANATKAALDSVLLARQPFHRVVQTRTTDVNVTLEARANRARNHGADIFISIHFNSGPAAARGTETLIQGSANVNIAADRQYATLVQAEAATAVGVARVPGVKDYNTRIGPGVPSDWGVLQDPRLGNTGNFRVMRSCIQEVDFITNAAALAILTDPVAGVAQRNNYASGVADAIVTDLETQPLP